MKNLIENMAYKAYNQNNYKTIPQISKLSDENIFNIDVVSKVLPFKTNNYVVDRLIDWDNFENDPFFILTFPQKGMLSKKNFDTVAKLLKDNADSQSLKKAIDKIRYSLNPHSSGQLEYNIPTIDGVKLNGLQHKYPQTLLFFPSHGQTCHAYCTFCFRWPQFSGIDELKFASRETELTMKYLQKHREITDILFTGGDPMIMRTETLKSYIMPMLDTMFDNIQTIRIGTKSLAFWPKRFLSDADSSDLLRLFENITSRGINLAIMAHFSHPRELDTEEAKQAIKAIRSTGAQIRTQSPVLKHINDSPEVWAEMWRKQVNHNCIPYYMFVPRDTGARDYFAVTLEKSWKIFQKAYQQVSGVCRTVRGPIMSATPGKIQVLGKSEVYGEKVFTMRMIQGRNPDWVARPFFAKFDKKALWISDLEPAFGESEFFFEKQLEKRFHANIDEADYLSFE